MVLERHQQAVEAVEPGRAADRGVRHHGAQVELVAEREELERRVGRIGGDRKPAFQLPAAARNAGIDAEANGPGLGLRPGRLVQVSVERDRVERSANPDDILARLLVRASSSASTASPARTRRVILVGFIAEPPCDGGRPRRIPSTLGVLALRVFRAFRAVRVDQVCSGRSGCSGGSFDRFVRDLDGRGIRSAPAGVAHDERRRENLGRWARPSCRERPRSGTAKRAPRARRHRRAPS